MTDITAPATALSPAERSIQAGDNRSFFGHPKALGSLFFVELWERFSYYGMRAILAFYIYAAVSMGGLGFSKQTAAVIVATYGASVYLLTIIGGIVGDRLIGARRATLYGGFVIMCGHIFLALPIGPISAWIGLCLVALGTGLEKPNISTLVGQLYTKDDPRRDGGFELFYMSVNIGSFFSPLVVGSLKSHFGYHVGFSAAAIGMAVALVIFWATTRSLHGAGESAPDPMPAAQRRRLPLIVVAAIVLIAGLFFLSRLWRGNSPAEQINDVVFLIALGATVYYFLAMYRHPTTSPEERKHVLAYIPLFLGGVMFYMVSEQAAGYMSVFAESNTNLHVGSFVIDPSWYQSVNPLGIVVMAPFVGWLFTRRAGRFPTTPVKFALAVLLIGLSALWMSALFAQFPGGSKLAPFWMLAAVFIVQTVAELFLSPVGLSTTTTLAPRHFGSQAMAVWYLSSSLGQSLAGLIISFLGGDSSNGGSHAMSQSYLINGGLACGIAVVLFALCPLTYKLMKDVEVGRRTMGLAERGEPEAPAGPTQDRTDSEVGAGRRH